MFRVIRALVIHSCYMGSPDKSFIDLSPTKQDNFIEITIKRNTHCEELLFEINWNDNINELVKGHFINCFSRFNTQYSVIFCWKMWVAFALQKLLTFFQQKISAYLRITRCKF